MLAPDINTEVEDFLARHLDAIAEKLIEPPVVHGPHCRAGKRVWLFTWRWPFIVTWISRSICICDINAILRGHRETQSNIDGIVAALSERPWLDLTPDK